MVIRASGYFIVSLERFCIDGERDMVDDSSGHPEGMSVPVWAL